MGYEAAEEVSYVLDKAEKSIFDVLQKRNTQGFALIKDVLIDTFNRLEELYNNKGYITGIPTGLWIWTTRLQGFKIRLDIDCGKTGHGEDFFCTEHSSICCIHAKVPVAIFSLEMSKEQLVNRMLCCEAMVDSQKMRTGKRGGQ